MKLDMTSGSEGCPTPHLSSLGAVAGEHEAKMAKRESDKADSHAAHLKRLGYDDDFERGREDMDEDA